jgi:hypothetical protein
MYITPQCGFFLFFSSVVCLDVKWLEVKSALIHVTGCLLMVKKCTKAAVDTVVMEVRWLVTEAVMGVQGAANMGGGVTKG